MSKLIIIDTREMFDIIQNVPVLINPCASIRGEWTLNNCDDIREFTYKHILESSILPDMETMDGSGGDIARDIKISIEDEYGQIADDSFMVGILSALSTLSKYLYDTVISKYPKGYIFKWRDVNTMIGQLEVHATLKEWKASVPEKAISPAFQRIMNNLKDAGKAQGYI